jgi:hypothetical protein
LSRYNIIIFLLIFAIIGTGIQNPVTSKASIQVRVEAFENQEEESQRLQDGIDTTTIIVAGATALGALLVLGTRGKSVKKPSPEKGGSSDDEIGKREYGLKSSSGVIAGRIVLVPGVPLEKGRVGVEGVPLGDRLDEDGYFSIHNVPPGIRNLRVSPEQGQKWELGTYARITVAVGAGSYHNIGTHVVSQHGAVSGKITGVNPLDLKKAIVSVKGFGVVAKPDEDGFYLLSNVPPEKRTIVLQFQNFALAKHRKEMDVWVKPGIVTRAVGFHYPLASVLSDTGTSIVSDKSDVIAPEHRVSGTYVPPPKSDPPREERERK